MTNLYMKKNDEKNPEGRKTRGEKCDDAKQLA